MHRPHPIGSDKRGPEIWAGKSYQDNVGAIIFDDCDRCDEHAINYGLTLDRQNFARAWGRMLDVEVQETGYYLSNNEARLCRQLDKLRVLLEKHGSVIANKARNSKALDKHLTDGIESLGLA